MRTNIAPIRALHTPLPIAGLEKLDHSWMDADGTVTDCYVLQVKMDKHAKVNAAHAAEALAEAAAAIDGTPLADMTLDPSKFPKLTLVDVIKPGDERYPVTLTPILDVVYTPLEWELDRESTDLRWGLDHLYRLFSPPAPEQDTMQETRLFTHLAEQHPMDIEGFAEHGAAVASRDQITEWIHGLADYAIELQRTHSRHSRVLRRELLSLGIDPSTPTRLQFTTSGNPELSVHDRSTGCTSIYVVKSA